MGRHVSFGNHLPNTRGEERELQAVRFGAVNFVGFLSSLPRHDSPDDPLGPRSCGTLRKSFANFLIGFDPATEGVGKVRPYKFHLLNDGVATRFRSTTESVEPVRGH